MEKNINLIIEDIKSQIINTINSSGLPISVIYYLMSDVYKKLDVEYKSYIEQAKLEEKRQALKESKEKETAVCNGGLFLLRNRDTKNRKHKIYGKRIDKTDISRYSDKSWAKIA